MDINQLQLFEFVKAGLFSGKDAQILENWHSVDWDIIFRLAEDQSIIGLVAAGIDTLKSAKRLPQKMVLQFMGRALQLELLNREMNVFIAELFDNLQRAGIYVVLVKGQGIAQCYEKPLWRTCGDIDILLNEENYEMAKEFLTPLASSYEEEDKNRRHLGMVINGWLVELHGTLHTRHQERLNRLLDEVQLDVFDGEKVRLWVNCGTQVYLPAPEEDVIFIFAHILQHFFCSGIGLRQICDLSRLLWTYRDSLDHDLLELRIQKAGIMTEWEVFAALIVDYLGMPVEAMPLYSDESKWSRKASRLMDFIMETGNFGHNRDMSYYTKYPFMIRKTISLMRSTLDSVKHFFIFPLDSVRVWWGKMTKGFRSMVKKGLS